MADCRDGLLIYVDGLNQERVIEQIESKIRQSD